MILRDRSNCWRQSTKKMWEKVNLIHRTVPPPAPLPQTLQCYTRSCRYCTGANKSSPTAPRPSSNIPIPYTYPEASRRRRCEGNASRRHRRRHRGRGGGSGDHTRGGVVVLEKAETEGCGCYRRDDCGGPKREATAAARVGGRARGERVRRTPDGERAAGPAGR